MKSLTVRWIISYTFWAALLSIGTFQVQPTQSLRGWGTDHISHYDSVFLFWKYGYSIYNRPSQELLETTPSGQNIHWGGKDLSLNVNWPGLPRPYPPGVYFLHAPLAAMKYFGASESAIRITEILFYLAIAHFFIAVAWLDCRRHWAMKAIFVILYMEAIRWSASGFYDIATVLCVWMSARAWALNQDPRRGWIWYCLGVFLGFRALWFAPLGLAHLYRMIQQLRAHHGNEPRPSLLPCMMTGVLAIASGVGALLYAPYLKLHQFSNPVHFSRWYYLSVDTWIAPPVIAALLAAAAYFRAWALFACMACASFFALNAQQSQAWHSLSLVPIFALVLSGNDRSGSAVSSRSLAVASVFFVVLSIYVFRHSVISGTLVWEFIADVHAAWNARTVGWPWYWVRLH